MTVRIVNVITRMIVGGPQQVSLLTARYYRGSPAVDYHLVFGRESGPEGDYHAEIAACRVPHHPQASLVRELAPARDLRALGSLVALLRRLRPHVVHARAAKARFLAPLAARLARVPITPSTGGGRSSSASSGSRDASATPPCSCPGRISRRASRSASCRRTRWRGVRRSSFARGSTSGRWRRSMSPRAARAARLRASPTGARS